MNDEYLWTKDGTDEEIERLESALSIFRGRLDESLSLWQTAQPQVVEAESIRWLGGYLGAVGRWRLSISFGLAVFLMVSLFLTYRSFVEERIPAPAVEIAAIEIPGREDPTLKARIAAVDEVSVREAVPERADRPSGSLGKRRPYQQSRRTKAARPIKADLPERLSDEERFAYRQLMIALSITGSKLKIVRDTVSGDGRSDAVPRPAK